MHLPKYFADRFCISILLFLMISNKLSFCTIVTRNNMKISNCLTIYLFVEFKHLVSFDNDLPMGGIVFFENAIRREKVFAYKYFVVR